MKDKAPFLEDGSQFGVSKTSFRRMRKAEKAPSVLTLLTPQDFSGVASAFGADDAVDLTNFHAASTSVGSK